MTLHEHVHHPMDAKKRKELNNKVVSAELMKLKQKKRISSVALVSQFLIFLLVLMIQ